MTNNELNHLEECLSDDNIKSGWKALITDEVLDNLKEALDFPPDDDDYKNIVPIKNQYLKAFSYADPENIKVVIIGACPALSVGNHLAFSTNEDPIKSKAIKRFNKAAEDAGIENDKDHESWARNGVLLINAALSMGGKSEKAEAIEKHNNRWFKFMKGLLSKWLDNIRRDHHLYVITLGYEFRIGDQIECKNYANHLWHEIYHSNNTNRGNITKMGIHYPTFPSDGELFKKQMTFCFRQILKTHKYIFDFDFDKRIEELNISINH